MSLRHWLKALACAIALVGAGPAWGQQADWLPGRESGTATLSAANPDAARGQALEWLKTAKADAAKLTAFEALWGAADRAVLDKVTGTLALGDPEAAKLLAEASNPSTPAPTAVPAIIKDDKKPAFYRANLALAYAKALTTRRVYEETLDTLKSVKADQVVDPAGYFFYRAVAEHALLMKNEANRSIAGLLQDVADTPDRYRMLALLMHFDIQSWKDKDLGEIARKMENIERRLDLARGGPKTQKIQREVVARLDELIKKLENQRKGES